MKQFVIPRTLGLAFWLVPLFLQPLSADGPADNQVDRVRPIPPPGIELKEGVGQELRAKALGLQQQLEEISTSMSKPEELRRRDLCAVIPRAVLMTLDTGMFYSDKEVEAAHELLAVGAERLERLKSGASELELLGISPQANDGLSQPQPVAGGFKSRIDGSVQPYGLILPSGWKSGNQQPMRLDVWLHGRGEKVSEVAFLQQRMKQLGEYTPPNTVVLHPYGRYCNAFKFAGEIDVLEAIEHVKQLLPIDRTRITIRGFSMGGAGCWQLAVHYPNLWAAANPGAGFSETTQFLKVFQQEEIQPTEFQQRLLHWYDCPDWTNNLRNVPTVAYSGEKDRQKQAADVMELAFAQRGMDLSHIIGPNTEHKIHADSKLQIERYLKENLLAGKQQVPRRIDLTTYMLRYHELGWLSVEGLEEHWRESRVQGEWSESQSRIALTTQGITRLKLQFPDIDGAPQTAIAELIIDGKTHNVAGHWPNPLKALRLVKSTSGDWQVDRSTATELAATLWKRPGLHGPIDDAFMDAFVMAPASPNTSVSKPADVSPVDRWVDSEVQHAATEWKRHFRGEPAMADPAAFKVADVRRNVILFGRPSTNQLLASVVEQLPIQWNDETLIVNGKTYSAKTHVPVMIYPLPIGSKLFSTEHYVVINSGFTYREYAYLNNARQVPMLPDWAVVDISQGATTQLPGKIVDAGFFDEKWEF